MKNIIKHIALGAVVLTATSCSLNMLPETSMTDAAYWQTEGDLRGACNRFYQQLNGNNALGGGFSHDYRSDELNNNGAANSTSDGSWTIPSENGSWTDAYWRIFIANNIIEKAPRAAVKEDVLNRYLAEARFFRAYYYFELVKKYGDVPLMLKAVNDTKDPELMIPRSPREEVMALVYEDLEFAATWLPDIDASEITGNWGHVAKQAATAMIVRAGLYEGTYGKFHNLPGDYKPHLKKSIDAAEALINSGKFELYPDFEQLFQVGAEGRQNRENIFVKVYGPNGSSASTTHGNSRQMENATTLTRNMVDLFLYTDGLPREKSPPEGFARDQLRRHLYRPRSPSGHDHLPRGRRSIQGCLLPLLVPLRLQPEERLRPVAVGNEQQGVYRQDDHPLRRSADLLRRSPLRI